MKDMELLIKKPSLTIKLIPIVKIHLFGKRLIKSGMICGNLCVGGRSKTFCINIWFVIKLRTDQSDLKKVKKKIKEKKVFMWASKRSREIAKRTRAEWSNRQKKRKEKITGILVATVTTKSFIIKSPWNWTTNCSSCFFMFLSFWRTKVNVSRVIHQDTFCFDLIA